MRGVHSVAEVREAERVAFEITSPSELMLRAATALAGTCVAVLNQSGALVYGSRIVLLVGGGNNGGDALYAGAGLCRRGAKVSAISVSDRVHADGAAAFVRAGGRVIEATDALASSELNDADLIIDGILGIGGEGGLRGPAAECAERATESNAVVVAVDLPSGVDADTGAVAGRAVWADVTVSFGGLKPGLLLPPGADHAGLVAVADIGLGKCFTAPVVEVLEAVDVTRLQPRPVPADHKYSRGVVGVAAGSARYPGAAVLTVGAALVTKPGLVRYVGAAASQVVTAWPSAVVGTGAPESAGRVHAWCVGPGLGVDDAGRETMARVLAQDLPTVVDADALTLLAAAPRSMAGRTSETVLTPHEGEFKRLATELELSVDRVAAVRALAHRFGCTVLLKGSTTVVADPDGRVRLNPTGTPWLATGGTGDVLTGMVGAYLAAGLSALDAASVAAFVHGVAGREASRGAPCTSLDVLNAVPVAIRALTDL